MSKVTDYLTMKDPVQKLQNRSNDVLSVFTKTVNDLKSINTEVDKEVATREEEKARIEEELSALNRTKASNELVVSKINKFFE